MATCVECDAEFDMDEVDVGDIVSCPECGTDMEVVSRKPLELDAVGDEEEEEDDDDDDDEEDDWG